jgi:glyoxylase-like metal-dependent hydrolase (beta-lactamase superfamily II)
VHGIKMQLIHVAPAHTSGDLFAYLPDKKMIFVGDLGGGSPHLENLGSSQGLIDSMKAMVALDADTFVMGHSAPSTKAAFQKTLADTEAKRAKIVQLFNEGKTLDEAERTMGERVVPRPTTPPPPGMQHFRSFRNMNYTENVYTELAWMKAKGMPAK